MDRFKNTFFRAGTCRMSDVSVLHAVDLYNNKKVIILYARPSMDAAVISFNFSLAVTIPDILDSNSVLSCGTGICRAAEVLLIFFNFFVICSICLNLHQKSCHSPVIAVGKFNMTANHMKLLMRMQVTSLDNPLHLRLFRDALQHVGRQGL